MKIKALLFSAVLGTTVLGGAAQAAPIEAYGALPAVENVSLSPSGKRVAMILSKGDQRIFAVRELEGDKKVLQSVGVNLNKLRGVVWADDDHVLVSMSQTYNKSSSTYAQEVGLLFLLNLKTGKAKQIAPSEDLQVYGLPFFSRQENNHSYAWFASPTGVSRVDLDSLQQVTAVQGREFDADYALTHDPKLLARMERFNHGKNWRLISEANQKTLAEGVAEVGGGDLEGLGRTPNTVLFRNTEEGEFASPHEIDLQTGKMGPPLVQGAASSAIHDRKTGLLIGFSVGGEANDIVLLDPAMDARLQSVKAAFRGQKVTIESYDEQLNRWVALVEGPHDSGHYYLIDIAQKKAIPIGASYPDVKAEEVGAFSWFDYTAGDGTPLKAVLTLPPGYTRQTAKNLPVVVLPHGGPAGHDRPHFDWWAQAIASRGYAVLQPNFRGSDGFGTKFERAGWGQWGKLMQTDVSDGLKALASAGVADPKRACIVGWSYGGYATLAGITVQNGLYRCAAAGGAVSDLNGMLTWERVRGGKESAVVRYWKKSMALNGESDPAGAAVSPLKLASRADAPLLLLHGRDDTVVPITQAKDMQAQLQRLGKPVEMVTLDGEDHWLSTAKTRTEMLKAMIGFITRYNPPSPSDAKVAAASN